jgi:hypothetical protein
MGGDYEEPLLGRILPSGRPEANLTEAHSTEVALRLDSPGRNKQCHALGKEDIWNARWAVCH